MLRLASAYKMASLDVSATVHSLVSVILDYMKKPLGGSNVVSDVETPLVRVVVMWLQITRLSWLI